MIAMDLFSFLNYRIPHQEWLFPHASVTRISGHKPLEHDESKRQGLYGHICILKEAVNMNQT